MVHFTLAIFASFTLMQNALADGFDSFGDQQLLENQVIITSGNISKRTSIGSYSNDLSYFDRQKLTIFEIRRFCFKSSGSFEDISGKAGILLVDQFSNTSIAVITESISSIKVKLTPVIVYDCISLSLQGINQVQQQMQQQTESLKQQIESLKQQRAILDQMLKEQRAASKKTP